jgi:hypothetical protein
MQETFELYNKRTLFYKIIFIIVSLFIVFIFGCIAFPQVISKAPQFLMIIWFVLGFVITIGSIFIGRFSIKTYITNGYLILTDTSVVINNNKYLLNELSSVETTAGGYKGRGTRGGISDGTGNKIVIKTNSDDIIKGKFVVNSKDQRGNLAQILKYWRSKGFKIISNGIDLI